VSIGPPNDRRERTGCAGRSACTPTRPGATAWVPSSTSRSVIGAARARRADSAGEPAGRRRAARRSAGARPAPPRSR
jgi:hypothetical protein